MSRWYEATMRSRTGEGTTPLRGSEIREYWAILAVLKIRQRAEPFLWAPPPGRKIECLDPRTVAITDRPGDIISGANEWY
ncbi:unnamed protein product, partial [Ascophyllum nodosum]